MCRSWWNGDVLEGAGNRPFQGYQRHFARGAKLLGWAHGQAWNCKWRRRIAEVLRYFFREKKDYSISWYEKYLPETLMFNLHHFSSGVIGEIIFLGALTSRRSPAMWRLPRLDCVITQGFSLPQRTEANWPKSELVARAFGAYELNAPIKFTREQIQPPKKNIHEGWSQKK